MVCDRCIMVVKEIFTRLNIDVESITLGEVLSKDVLSYDKIALLKEQLESVGFEILVDQHSKTIEQIKNTIRDLVRKKDGELKIKLSDYLSGKVNFDYNYLSTLFSEIEGNTIEQYYISQKIERVKELLLYDNISLGEIAHLLNYSSTAHLSGQFKKVTGVSPRKYKELTDKNRKPLDKVCDK